MSAVFAAQNHIRIIRPETRPAGKTAFQREWEPLFCPETLFCKDPWPRFETVETENALRVPRIPRRFYSAVMGTALTVALTAIVSLGMTIRTVGLTPDAGAFWLAAWQFAALIAVPARFVLTPLVANMVGRLVEPPIRGLNDYSH